MTAHASTQLLTRDEALDLLTDMLKQAEEDKKTLREALDGIADRLEAWSEHHHRLARSTQGPDSDRHRNYYQNYDKLANSARAAIEKVDR